MDGNGVPAREKLPSVKSQTAKETLDVHLEITCSVQYLTQSTLKSRTENCVVMLPLGNRTGTLRMLSLTTGMLVNRDQFTIMPMPKSFIKRMNALALADGRVKRKSELVRTGNTYEIISDNIDELPEMIETTVNEGVDPSTTLLDANYNPELMYDEVVEQIDETRPDEP